MKRSASYLSMENLDLNEDENGEQGNESQESDADDLKKPSNLLDPGNASTTAGTNTNSNPLDIEVVSIDPTYILNRGFKKVSAVGSSTALVAIRNQKSIHIANLGDSGFILIRFRDG